MRVVKIVYEDGFEMDLEREDGSIIDTIRKAPGKKCLYQNKDTGEYMKALEEWYLLSEKLFLFWIQMGCPKLPEWECPINGGVSYRRR